jgi:hypothetical protein
MVPGTKRRLDQGAQVLGASGQHEVKLSSRCRPA